MRLDKFIANNTAFSRKEAKRAAKNGEVIVNGQPVKDLSQSLPANAQVSVFGQAVLAIEDQYLMFYKPLDVVCSTDDGYHATVINVLTEAALAAGDEPLLAALDADINLQVVGRLDIDTTGLLLITSDGQWNHRVTSPNHSCGKTYRVTIAEPLTETAKTQLEQGVLLDDSVKPTKPAEVTIIDEQHILLTLFEGRYHQVKRMLAAVGNAVVGLHRERIGELHLGEDLQPGDYRTLTAHEIASF
ncbi:pseudouridine synthase [Halioxenophilus aromaticivorans]|uniref:Pseudouridine synthase n=1 Tax=Halioxenophilus aromaticivorans TaxID=1306992 RepID=A0AAV3UB61_9ALTE